MLGLQGRWEPTNLLEENKRTIGQPNGVMEDPYDP